VCVFVFLPHRYFCVGSAGWDLVVVGQLLRIWPVNIKPITVHTHILLILHRHSTVRVIYNSLIKETFPLSASFVWANTAENYSYLGKWFNLTFMWSEVLISSSENLSLLRFCPGLNRSRYEIRCSTSTNAGLKNEWLCTSAPPIFLHCVDRGS